MKNKLTLVLIMVSLVNIQAQNLVPNYSFEQHDTCIYYGAPPETSIGWHTGNSYTPDYYNACAPAYSASVPYNMTYQPAATGSAYMGIYTFQKIPGDTTTNIRDVIGTQLSSSLVNGGKYFVSLKVNLCLQSYVNYYAVNNIGLLFSTVLFSSGNHVPINNFAHIHTTSIVTDTAGWSIISGVFIADSVYRYVYIGNFFDDNNTSYIRLLNDSNNIDTSAYYFIDDVCVSLDSTTCDLPVNTLSNKFTCEKCDKISISPNPVKQEAFISVSDFPKDKNKIKIQVFNLYGNLMLQTESNFVNNHFVFQSNNLPNGLYMLYITFGSDIYIRKIIINH